ncbi:RDD family protein [bacterium]|nr:RDD family protein [bacterium]
MPQCPRCKEETPPEATVCPHCGLALPPSPPPLAALLGEVLIQTEREPSAPAPSPTAPQDAAAWSDRAVAQVEAGDLLGAFASFQEALNRAPNHAETWFRLGGAYYRTSAYRHAERAFQRALELAPDHPRARFWAEEARRRGGPVDPPAPEVAPPSPLPAKPTTDRPAHPLRRAFALAVDLALVTCSFCLATAVAQAILLAMLGPGALDLSSAASTAVLSILAYFAVLYFSLSHAAAGQTPGMLFVGIRLVDRRGRPPGFLLAFLRDLCFFLLFCITALSALVVPGSSLHDKLAGTHVVENG